MYIFLMSNMKNLLLMIGWAVVLMAAGCGPQQNTQNAATGETITVSDAKYGDQQVPLDPQKVVSFDYGALDTMAALGLESRVAALPKSNLPHLLQAFADDKYANAGNLFEPNFELLYTIKPDLIIVSGRAAAKIEELRKIAPTIFLEPKNEDYYNTFKANTELLGRIFKREDEAKQKLAELDARMERLSERTRSSGKTGLISLYTAGKISVYGPRSRFGILHQAMGIKPADPNIQEAAQHGQVVNFEYLKKIDPDYLFVVDRAKILGEETLAKTFLDNEVVRSTKAAREDHIIYLDTENWYTVSGGLQSMSKMIDEIAAAFNVSS